MEIIEALLLEVPTETSSGVAGGVAEGDGRPKKAPIRS